MFGAHRNVDEFKGQEITCKIIKINRKRNNVVVSRKLALEEELQSPQEANWRSVWWRARKWWGRSRIWRTMASSLTWAEWTDSCTSPIWPGDASVIPRKCVQVGQEIRVKVLKHDIEKGRVSLGLKQLTPDPWEMVPRTYHPGDRVSGRVVSLTDYGAFVELEPGVEGLYPHFGNELEQAPASSLQDSQDRGHR